MFNIKRTMYLQFYKQARRQRVSTLSENASKYMIQYITLIAHMSGRCNIIWLLFLRNW